MSEDVSLIPGTHIKYGDTHIQYQYLYGGMGGEARGTDLDLRPEYLHSSRKERHWFNELERETGLMKAV